MQSMGDILGQQHPIKARSGAPGRGGWEWHLELGRWRPEFGLPSLPEVISVSTDSVPMGDRYDYWRDLVFYNFDADPLDRDASRSFSASGFGTPFQEAEIHRWRSDAMQGRRTLDQAGRDGADTISVGFVLAGTRSASFADGTEVTGQAGQAFVYDSARSSRVRWSRHEGLHLVLRREAVVAALGADVPCASELTARLAGLPLISLLRDQLVSTSGIIADLPAPERAFALGQVARLATFALMRTGTGRPADARHARAAVHAAAVQLIERNLASTQLAPARIAAALGCSRSTLFRAFADRDETVQGAIQAVRLHRAQAMLLATGREIPVAEVAARCGFYDASNFSARFRSHFGYRPSERRLAGPEY
jgi:AraC-like DNA-binding protein